MKSAKKITMKINYFLFALLFLFFTSCKTDIKDIKLNRSEFLGKEVTVEGVVSGSIPMSGIYELKQDDATIYVYTQNELPEEGWEIKVTGVVKENKVELGFIKVLNEAYIEEKTRK
jgi:hypothetical protein